MKTLHVTGRYLADQHDKPFFYLGDTAWEIFHSLSREEADFYLEERARQGFNVIQAVALAEFDGIRTPNAYGRHPFKSVNGSWADCIPDEEEGYNYWMHVDYIIEAAAKLGLFIAFLPTWGDKFNISFGKGPEIFNPQNAYSYARWLAKRYKSHWNIIWMLGGDRPLEPSHVAVIEAMAQGIKSSGDTHLITFHPYGGSVSTECLANAEYIDFHTAQTGHATVPVYASHEVMQTIAKATDKPFMDSEPRYEDHPACFNASYGYLWNADDIRQNAYWNLLAGVCGHTYGNHSIWAFNRQIQEYWPFRWNDVLRHDGAEQIHFIKDLRLSRDYFSFCSCPELVIDNVAIMGHIASGKGDGYAYIYSPLGLPFVAHLDLLNSKDIKASWFDPRSGETKTFAVLPGEGDAQFVPPTQGKGCDWILILDVLEK